MEFNISDYLRILLVENLRINQSRELFRRFQNLYPEESTSCDCFALPVFACLYMVFMNLYINTHKTKICSQVSPQCHFLSVGTSQASPVLVTVTSVHLASLHPKAHCHFLVRLTVFSSAGDMVRNKKGWRPVLECTAK